MYNVTQDQILSEVTTYITLCFVVYLANQSIPGEICYVYKKRTHILYSILEVSNFFSQKATKLSWETLMAAILMEKTENREIHREMH